MKSEVIIDLTRFKRKQSSSNLSEVEPIHILLSKPFLMRIGYLTNMEIFTENFMFGSNFLGF